MNETRKRLGDGRQNAPRKPKRKTLRVKNPRAREHAPMDLPTTPAPDIGAHAIEARMEVRTRQSKSPLLALAPHVLEAMIAEAAYYRAERRGFTPGRELEDWLQAERDILRALACGSDERV